MAKYSGTFACGCEGYVNVIGPGKDRQWKIDRAFSNSCEECSRKAREERIAKENAEALEKAKEMELPALEGTEKQVVWANTIRNTFLEKLDETITLINDEDNHAILTFRKLFKLKKSDENIKDKLVDNLYKFQDIFLENTKASYFINNRMESIRNLVEREAENIVNADEIRRENEIKIQVIKETTVEPKEVKHYDVVDLIVSKEVIKLKYERNTTFIDIVKNLDYKWENGCWQRSIKETTGSYMDRAAEVANKLLNAGFRVAIPEEDIKEKALNGDYEKECYRWIFNRKDTNKLAINWHGYNEKLYSASKSLRGAKWDSPSMLVDVRNYEQVEEFAEMYGFKFTKSATKLIEKYKVEYEKQMSKIEKVDVVEVKKVKEKNGLEDILNSSREVLLDLVEED